MTKCIVCKNKGIVKNTLMTWNMESKRTVKKWYTLCSLCFDRPKYKPDD